MKEHFLKILPIYFNAIIKHNKTFELRKNDRDFQVNDIIVLREYDKNLDKLTGSYVKIKIKYIYKGNNEYGLSKGYVIMSFDIMKIHLN